jgi:hypothetical protein
MNKGYKHCKASPFADLLAFRKVVSPLYYMNFIFVKLWLLLLMHKPSLKSHPSQISFLGELG